IETGICGNCGGVRHFLVGHWARPKYRAELGDFGAELLDLGVKQCIRTALGNVNVLAKSVAFIAGYGIRLLTVV
ncbi:hypothetical protein, partial [Staphylococcus aureus]|uniref:hypothetical protein n=1 Tax=Staphylococcus aureus TaxID=1280 RepID=UPI001F425768